MGKTEDILGLEIRPKEKQTKLVEAIVSGKIAMEDFIPFFIDASGVNKGTCADVMKHVSAEKPELLAPYIDVLMKYINYKVPRVQWGVPEAIGNMAKEYPKQTEKAIKAEKNNGVKNVYVKALKAIEKQ